MPSKQSRTLRPVRHPHSPDFTPLEVQRHNWETEALKVPLPEGTTVLPISDLPINGERVSGPAASAGVILYLHGGGFTQGSSKTHRHLAALLARSTGHQVLNLDYPLAPEHPFPTAIEGTVEVYRHLMEQGQDPAHILFGGDSAGAQVALAALLQIREAQWPLPAGAVFISPWLDLSLTGESMKSHAKLDPMVSREGLQQAANAYLQGQSASGPLASPLFADLQGLPPLLVLVGGQEVLLDDSRRLAQRALEAGVQVDLQVFPDMWHVWPAWGEALPEAMDAFETIRDFAQNLAGTPAR